jgi:hypothetical protein
VPRNHKSRRNRRKARTTIQKTQVRDLKYKAVPRNRQNRKNRRNQRERPRASWCSSAPALAQRGLKPGAQLCSKRATLTALGTHHLRAGRNAHCTSSQTSSPLKPAKLDRAFEKRRHVQENLLPTYCGKAPAHPQSSTEVRVSYDNGAQGYSSAPPHFEIRLP